MIECLLFEFGDNIIEWQYRFEMEVFIEFEEQSESDMWLISVEDVLFVEDVISSAIIIYCIDIV